MPPEICPACGAEVPRQAKACPGCGTDETTGWSEQARTDALDLPDENFDYNEFVQREFSGKETPPRRLKPLWHRVALLLLLLMATGMFLVIGRGCER